MDAPTPRIHRPDRRSARRPLTLAIQGLCVATASSLMLWTAGGGFDLPQPKLMSAATKPEKQAVQSSGGMSRESQPRTVKLNYLLGSTWDKVFQDVAEATGSQLIADRVPKGRFSRRDATEYTRHDAVRILNKEIEPLGFRLIEKGDFLVVIDLPSTKPRYQPAVVSKDASGKETVVDPNLESSSPFQRRIDTITPRDEALDAAREEVAQSEADAARLTTPRRTVDKRTTGKPGVDRTVRQVSHENEDNVTAPPVSRRAVANDVAAPARLDEAPATDTAPTVGESHVVFRPKHRKVLDLSKQVYRTFKPRAQLITHGRDGLPAFRIESAAAAKPEGDQPAAPAKAKTAFTIAIDEAGDELLIDGSPGETDAVVKLLRSLDTPFDLEEAVQVTASSKYVCQIAGQLPAEIERLRAARKKVEGIEARQAGKPLWLAQNDQPGVPGDDLREAPRMAQLNVPAGLGDVFSNLKGQVEIQPLPDLNAIVIKGAADDVEQVMKVIRQLEQLSEATAPKVHLLYLKHVDAESLAELLTSVYEQLTKFPALATQPRQNAAILPVNKPNALLIVAPKADLEAILELADQLDRPVDPLTEFQVFKLKTAIAAQLQEQLTEFYAERKNLGAKVLVVADIRSNSLIVRAQARELDEIGELIRELDHDDPQATSLIKVFPLKNAVATELAAVMNAAIQSVLAPPTASAGGGQQGGLQGLNPGQVDEQFKNVKSTVLQFLLIDKDGEKLMKSGILSDIRITPDSRANSLIVAASEQSMTLIGELIKQLDKPTSTVSEIKVFTLANADAELMVAQLNTLFNNQQQGGQGNRQQGLLGISLAGADDASSSLVPLKFSIDKRTNSIIASGAPDALKVVEAILLRLDESDVRARQTLVLRLQNSPAAQAAIEINQFYASQRELTQQDPNLVSSVEQLERDVVVVADTATNSLIISATPRYFEDIKKMVAKLDEPPRQVIIQALLVEVELANTDEFGIELGFQDSLLFRRSVLDTPNTISTTTTSPNGVQTTTQTIISQTGQPGFNFNNPSIPLGNNLNANPGRVGAQGLSNFSLGRVNGDLGFGGLVLSAGSESVNVLLRALSAHRKIQVLSRPQIRALDNQQAEIFSGQTIPVVNGFTQGNLAGSIVPTVQRENAGIQLMCIPRVTEDGQVFMQVSAQRSQYRNEGVPLATDVNGNTVESPILDISRANTTISVSSGQTVVIGGLINTRDENFTNKVPLLGDIPLIGTAFRYDSRSTRRVELLVFLTPRVINGPCDEETIKEVEMGRLHFIESEAEGLHGPLRALPGPDQVFNEDGTPWSGSGQSLPGGYMLPPAPAATVTPPTDGPTTTPVPPQPMLDDSTSRDDVIRDPAVSPAGAARLQYTETDDKSINIKHHNSGDAKKMRPNVKNDTYRLWYRK